MKNNIAIQASDNKEENKEIIKILENLGGKNINNLIGEARSSTCYFIREDNIIYCTYLSYNNEFLKNRKLYTLNEYKKEFMESKEIKITPPEGYEIDKENSTFEKIVFKKIKEKLTYEKIVDKLFTDKKYYYISDFGDIKVVSDANPDFCDTDSNNAPTSHQLQKLLAINKLMNVAYYLNDGWEPDWSDTNLFKYYLHYDHHLKKILIDFNLNFQKAIVYFKSKKLAEQAIEILGEETIKLALGVI